MVKISKISNKNKIKIQNNNVFFSLLKILFIVMKKI